MADLTVHIVTPERAVYSGFASDVRLPGWNGEMQVLPEHEVLLSLLRGGIVQITTPAGPLRYVVGRGFAEVTGGQVTLLADHCESADEGIDKGAAQATMQECERRLGEIQEDTPEWDAISEEREIAVARLMA